MKKGKSFYSYLRLLLAGRKGGEINGCWTIPFLVNILTKDWGEIMVPHYVHQINIMSKAAASLICVCWLLGHMMSDSFLPTSLNAYLTYNIYIFSNIHVYLVGNPRDTDVSVHKLKRGGLDATCREGAAKTMQLQKKKKILNILCVDWSIADLVMVHCGSNPFPVYGIFTPSQQSRKNHMVKCCLIYGKCINAKRLFFFLRGCFEYPLQWVAEYSWCAKI